MRQTQVAYACGMLYLLYGMLYLLLQYKWSVIAASAACAASASTSGACMCVCVCARARACVSECKFMCVFVCL